MNFSRISLAFGMIYSLLAASPANGRMADLQFFGDTYLSKRMLRYDGIFSGVKSLMDSAHINIINFEGVIRPGGSMPFDVRKRYLLVMADESATILKQANVHVASLANNHSFDFGEQGLFHTITALESAGIKTLGAGFDEKTASKPLIVSTRKGNVCLLSYSRTLPMSFWAKNTRAGTASQSFSNTAKQVSLCRKKAKFTFVLFHWGEEHYHKTKPYQRKLARVVLKAGATAVLGHHPHVIQPIEVVEGRYVFYSLGNFVFGSYKRQTRTQGYSVKVYLGDHPTYELTPLRLDAKAHRRHFERSEKSRKDPSALSQDGGYGIVGVLTHPKPNYPLAFWTSKLKCRYVVKSWICR